MFRILIAHDGSACSEAAVDDLKNAGLPEDAEAVVLSVADDWSAKKGYSGEPEIRERYLIPYAGFNFAEMTYAEARQNSEETAAAVRRDFPSWNVRSDAGNFDSAFEGVLTKIQAWRPDLVVMGSHGRSAAGRLFFGSVSHKVLSRVHCNLRICRKRARKPGPPRVLVAFDGSQEAETAFLSAICRSWPAGTAVRLATVADAQVSRMFIRPTGPASYWAKADDLDPGAWVERMFADQSACIAEKGLLPSTTMLAGDPKRALLKEAEEWSADTIFAGCRGLGRRGIIAGSVSTALAVHAPCSVEVIHRLWTASCCCDKALDEHRACMSRS